MLMFLCLHCLNCWRNIFSVDCWCYGVENVFGDERQCRTL